MATDTRVLADGSAIPLLGLGVWQVRNGPECENAVRWALELGYRHVDTAQAYGNEESVGRALRDSGVPRDEVFLTTKFYPGRRRDPEAEAQRSLERLRIERLDLYIIHWPEGGPTWAWPGMERAQERGFAQLVPPARHDRHSEADAPRADRGEQPDLRLRAVRRGHGRTRRPGRNRRHRPGPRATLVVKGRGAAAAAAAPLHAPWGWFSVVDGGDPE